jgi:5'-deoxynucleotidase YfbR-like HD superfamily hydrolase
MNILEPHPADFTNADLALGLSREPRWNGQTAGDFPFSVGQHSILVLHIMRQKLKVSNKTALLYGLLHDAEEGLGIKDTISGLKYVLGEAYIEIALSIREAVHLAYGLTWPADEKTTRIIKKADHISAATEAVYLMNFDIADYRTRVSRRVFPLPPIEPWRNLLTPWPPVLVANTFLNELQQLTSEPQRK